VSGIDTETAARYATWIGTPVTARTIRRWVHEGRIRNLGTARRVRVDLADLDDTLSRTSEIDRCPLVYDTVVVL